MAYAEEIWALVAEGTEVFGYHTVLAFIASLDNAEQVEDEATFKNLLAWYAVEVSVSSILKDREAAVL